MTEEINIDHDAVVEKMLNGVPIEDFLAFFAWALIGMLVIFFMGVGNNVQKNGWQWARFWNGWKRILVNVFLIAIGIIFWPNLSKFFFDNETPVELTMWSSLTIGLMLDRLRSWVKSLAVKK